MKKEVYKISEFAKLIGVSIKNLQRWDNEGLLIAVKSPKGKRYYTHKQYLEYMGLDEKSFRKTVTYSRVSTFKGNIESQVDFLNNYAKENDILIDEAIQDTGSSLNYERQGFKRLISECVDNKIGTVIITNEDRLVRFGFSHFKRLFSQFGIEIIVLNEDRFSPKRELLIDFLSIIDTFSEKLPSLLRYRATIRDDKFIKGECDTVGDSN
ncbi:MAG: IS607 family transposase [Peptostreptococcaceae bacterium]